MVGLPPHGRRKTSLLIFLFSYKTENSFSLGRKNHSNLQISLRIYTNLKDRKYNKYSVIL